MSKFQKYSNNKRIEVMNLSKYLLCVILVIGFALASSQVINTQGVLRDADNKAVPNDVYTIVFTIYDDQTGGSSLWSKSKEVNVINGVYSVSLDVGEDLFNTTTTNGLWLELNVDNDGPMDRLQLHLSPYDCPAPTNWTSLRVSIVS